MIAIDGNNNSIKTPTRVKPPPPQKDSGQQRNLAMSATPKPQKEQDKQTTKGHKSIRSQLGIMPSLPSLFRDEKESFSQDEKAFMVLFDLDRKEYSAIKSDCGLKHSDSIGDLTQKVRQVLGDKTLLSISLNRKYLEKVKNSIAEFEKYQQKINDLFTELRLKRNDYFEQMEKECNKAISHVFKLTLALHGKSKGFKRYFDILTKYKIFNPLNVSRKTLDKMTILEETQFTEITDQLKNLAISNLSFNRMMHYKDLEKWKDDATNNFITEAIKLGKKELMPLRQRELKAQEILESKPEDKKTMIDALTKEAQSIIRKYEQARVDLAAALRTKDINDDKQAREELKAIHAELILEIENEYSNAFVETPSTPEKKALKALLMATAELEIIDKEIIYYARLSNDILEPEERQIINELKKKGIRFSKQKVNPQDLTNLTAKAWIASYSKEVQPILTKYAEVTREYLKTCCDVNKIWIGQGKDHGTALFFALKSIGFSESELLFLDAMIAYKFLSPASKKIPKQDTPEKAQKACLKEFKRLINIRDADNFRELSDSERGHILQEIECLAFIFNGMVGSIIKAGYLFDVYTFDKKYGLLLESEFCYAEYTPEAHDDLKMRQEFRGLFKNGAEQFGLDPLSIIHAHIYIRSITNEPIDKSFINEILQYSSLYGLMALNGQYGLDTFKQEFMQCITYQALEYNLQDKPKFSKSKEEIKKWIRGFIGQTKKEVDKNPNYSGTPEMQTKVAILGNIYTLLTEFKIMNEDELSSLYSENPIISVKPDLTMEDLKNGKAYHTRGYTGLPIELRTKIEQSGFSEFCKKHSDLLNIYWVPYDEKNTSFGGYAIYDKNTIVVVYQYPEGEQRKPVMNSAETLTEITIHELRHKVDTLELRKYCASHPNHNFPFLFAPSLITERNAYLTGLLIYEKSKKKTPKIKEKIRDLREVIAKANILLGLPENNQDFLHPPYDGINLYSLALEINPVTITLPLKDVKTILRVLDKLGYNTDEKKWLFERCMLIAAGYAIDLQNVKAGRRDLLVDFLGKLINLKAAKTDGFLSLNFIRMLEAAKKTIKDPSGTTIVSLKLLSNLLAHHLREQKSKK